MKNIRKNHYWIDIGEDARRQFIDAKAVFTAWEDARKKATEVRGSMYWKRQGVTQYLIRTSPNNSQKSLGPRSRETTTIFKKFMVRKEQIESRLSDLSKELVRHQRMNRALHVGRAPRLLVNILNQLSKSGLSEFFTVVGTHALYAYEAAAGVQLENAQALATRDVDLLLDTRKRLSFMTQMEHLDSSLLELIKKVDVTFEIRQDQKYTAVNSKGFEVDIIHDNFYAVQARNSGLLLDGPRFSSMIVSVTGHMARMNTIAPLAFVKFKKWMSKQPNRDSMKKSRDVLQANLVNEMLREYLPNLS